LVDVKGPALDREWDIDPIITHSRVYAYGCVDACVCVRACVCVYKDNSMDRTGLRTGASGECRRLAPQYGT
jgi:hypothetical protein